MKGTTQPARIRARLAWSTPLISEPASLPLVLMTVSLSFEWAFSSGLMMVLPSAEGDRVPSAVRCHRSSKRREPVRRVRGRTQGHKPTSRELGSPEAGSYGSVEAKDHRSQSGKSRMSVQGKGSPLTILSNTSFIVERCSSHVSAGIQRAGTLASHYPVLPITWKN